MMATTDLTKQVDLTHHDRGTGALRTRRPNYVDFLPPCNDACPAGENIHAFVITLVKMYVTACIQTVRSASTQ